MTALLGLGAATERLLQRVRPRLGDLRVLGGEHTRHADAADDLAVHHDRDAAFERRRPFQLQDAKPGAAPGDDVLEGLGGPTETHRGGGLTLGNVDAPVLRVVEPLERYQMSAAVDD